MARPLMRMAGIDEATAGIKVGGRNINNLRYADDITLLAKTSDDPKSLIRKVKEKSATVGLKLNMKKTFVITNAALKGLVMVVGEMGGWTPISIKYSQ